MALQAIDPATGEALAAYEEMSIRKVQGIIADAISGGAPPALASGPPRCPMRLRFCARMLFPPRTA
jgi:hypothetical protein